MTITPIGGGIGKLLFVDSAIGIGISIINTDGTNLISLHSDKPIYSLDDWSSVYQRIYFDDPLYKGRWYQHNEVFSMNLDGSDIEQINIPGVVDLSAIKVSPDGKHIIGASCIDSPCIHRLLYRGDFDGKTITHLVKFIEGDDASWSPDGNNLVFTSYYIDYPIENIYTIKIDGARLVNISKMFSKYGYINSSPAWSPDGLKIVFNSDMDGKNRSIYTMNPDGSNVTKIINNGWGPSYSPDGLKITFTQYVEGERGPKIISIMNSNGTDARQLITCTGNCWSPIWV